MSRSPPPYTIDIEPLTACLRVFAKGRKPRRDPFVVACTIAYSDDGETVELKGLTLENIPPDHIREGFRAICQALAAAGVRRLEFNRRRDGSKRTKTIDTATGRLIHAQLR